MSKPNSALQVLVAAMGIVVPAMAQAPAVGTPAPAPAAPPPAPVAATQDIEPTRPISIVADLRACAAQPASSRPRCLTEAASNLKHGLDYQECLWGTVPSAQCRRALPPRAPSQSEAELLNEGRQLVADMEATAKDPTVQLDLNARLKALLPKAAAKIRETRGAYTLVSQGGVSLGSWQAGYIYYLTELLKNRRENKQEPAFRTLTGASAGAVNALAAGIEGCRTATTGPKDSLFYKVWVESLGMFQKSGPELFPTDEPTAVSKECKPYVTSMASDRLGLFDSAPLCQAMSYANEALRQAPNDICAFNVGFSVTHLHGVKETVYQNEDGGAKIDATKLTEYFALNVRPRPKQSPLERRSVRLGQKSRIIPISCGTRSTMARVSDRIAA